MKVFGSSSAKGVRLGLKNESIGLVPFKSGVCTLAEALLDEANGLLFGPVLLGIAIGSFERGSRSPCATPIATCAGTSSPKNGMSPMLNPSGSGVRCTSCLVSGQKTH